MKAQVLTALKTPLQIQDIPDREPAADEVIVGLRGAALNRRDYWITQGRYPGIKFPIVLGSDGVGVVLAAGSKVEGMPAGEVIINPGWDWGTNQNAQSNDFTILGMPHHGTFAERVHVPARYVHAKPAHLDVNQAAALPLAGVTAYRGIFSRGKLLAGENLLVTGIGGGVATFAVQYGVAAGANVYVTSSSDQKIERAISLGARGGYNYRDPHWAEKIQKEIGMMDLIFDGAGGAGFAQLIEVASPGGRIVNYGGTAGAPEKFEIFRVYWKQLSLLGSTMGSESDFANMLKFVSEKRIVPIVDEVFPWQEANDALRKISESSQFGKLVLATQ